MKRIVYCGIWMCFDLLAQAQALTHEHVSVYEQTELISGEACIWIPVYFNNDDLLKAIPDSLRDLVVTKIDLVYTTYKLNPSFDQEQLNANRIDALQDAWPASTNEMIYWRAVGQTGALNAEDAQKFFHGFVIYYRPFPTTESIARELDFMDKYLGQFKDTNMTVAENPDLKKYEHRRESALIAPIQPDGIYATYSYIKGEPGCHIYYSMTREASRKQMIREVDSISSLPLVEGNTFKQSKTKNSRKKKYTITWILKADTCEIPIGDVIMVSDSSASPVYKHYDYDWMNNPEYGVVEVVFNRNPQWIQSLIVIDVTGSMSPYIAKTMAWIKATQKSEQVQAFIFFNDGNKLPDASKHIGRVGGIYGTTNTDFETVYQTMKGTMNKGGGGDCPENNIEATLKGIEMYPDCKEIVMVADNWATPRDLELVKALNRPVHVILCGASVAINLAYVQLAYDTGGSVHTIEQDLDAWGIEPGKIITLGKSTFTLSGGKIVQSKKK